jgi:hypothetical protein
VGEAIKEGQRAAKASRPEHEKRAVCGAVCVGAVVRGVVSVRACVAWQQQASGSEMSALKVHRCVPPTSTNNE